jgi:hypothetical protein
MPSASPELQAEWPGYDAEAIAHLKAAGFKLNGNWTWKLPNPGYKLTDRDFSAIRYLIDEWDFGGPEGRGCVEERG